MSREEGHVDALEQQLSNMDNDKEQLERKLHSVYASLRTVTRMYQEPSPGSPLKARKAANFGKENFLKLSSVAKNLLFRCFPIQNSFR